MKLFSNRITLSEPGQLLGAQPLDALSTEQRVDHDEIAFWEDAEVSLEHQDRYARERTVFLF